MTSASMLPSTRSRPCACRRNAPTGLFGMLPSPLDLPLVRRRIAYDTRPSIVETWRRGGILGRSYRAVGIAGAVVALGLVLSGLLVRHAHQAGAGLPPGCA